MEKFINESKKHFTIDYILLAIILLLASTSIISIYLAKPFLNLADSNALIIRQFGWYIVSFTALYIFIKLGPDRLFSASYLAYWILMFFLLLLVLARFRIIKTSLMPEINGSYAWFVIPALGSFQPSEFMKIVLVIIFADIIHEHNREKTSIDFASDFQLIFKIAKYALPALFLNFLQPDTGIPIIIVFSLAVMFFLSGVRREWFLIIVTLASVLFFGIIYLYYNHFDFLYNLMGGGYRLNRFHGWLNFEEYPQTHGFQLYQSLLAIGTAGLKGHPLMEIITKIPEAHTDFIFAVITQNFGFLGGSFVIVLSFSLTIKLLLITLNSNLPRERYMMMGVIGMLMFQHFQNIGMIMGILPITGITLPFISYGGSSILSYMIPLSVAFYMSSETENEHKH